MTRKNAGPLTTAFEAPSRCFDRTLDSAVFSSLDQGGYEFAQDLSIFMTDLRSAHSICPSEPFVPCLPNQRRHRKVQERGVFFSPGLECPTSWRTVASVTASNTTGSFLYVNGIAVSTLLPDESAHVCCPMQVLARGRRFSVSRPMLTGATGSGFDYMVNLPPSPPVVYCTSAVSRFDGAHKQWSCAGNSTLAEMTGTDAGYAITLTSTWSGRTSRTPVSFTSVKLYAPTIQLNRRPRDAAASPTGGTRREDGQPRAAGLGGGAVAGIAVGIVALLGVAAALVWKRRRRGAGRAEPGAGRDEPELDGAARLDGVHCRSELEARGLERHELGADQIFELGEGRGGEVAGDADERARRWSSRGRTSK